MIQADNKTAKPHPQTTYSVGLIPWIPRAMPCQPPAVLLPLESLYVLVVVVQGFPLKFVTLQSSPQQPHISTQNAF